MAKNLTKSSGSIFMGNPITYQVKAEGEPVDKDGNILCTFHRVKLKLTRVGYTDKSYELSLPVSYGGEILSFDISSVFRSAADGYSYNPVSSTFEYPMYTFNIEARDVWMKDGRLIDPAHDDTPGDHICVDVCSAITGAFSDYERRQTSQNLSFSRKPLIGELVCVGDKVVFGGASTIDPTIPCSYVKNITATNKEKYVSLSNGQKVWVLPSVPKGSRLFQFVNSRGVVESIRAFQHEKEIVKGGSEEHTISRMETFNVFSRIVTTKKDTRTEFAFSSGFVNYEWAMWWVHEFGQSNTHWMLTPENVWLPCSVSVNESVTVVDRSKNDLCYVEFTCKPNINGGMW